MLRWFPKFQVEKTRFSSIPLDLNSPNLNSIALSFQNYFTEKYQNPAATSSSYYLYHRKGRTKHGNLLTRYCSLLPKWNLSHFSQWSGTWFSIRATLPPPLPFPSIYVCTLHFNYVSSSLSSFFPLPKWLTPPYDFSLHILFLYCLSSVSLVSHPSPSSSFLTIYVNDTPETWYHAQSLASLQPWRWRQYVPPKCRKPFPLL